MLQLWFQTGWGETIVLKSTENWKDKTYVLVVLGIHTYTHTHKTHFDTPSYLLPPLFLKRSVLPAKIVG